MGIKSIRAYLFVSIKKFSIGKLKSTPLREMSSVKRFLDFDANVLHIDLRTEAERLMKCAANNDIGWFVVPGSTLTDSRDTLMLSSENKDVLSTCGVHPYHTKTNVLDNDSKANLDHMVQDVGCLAVGECGLDYSNGFPDRSFQLHWFEYHFELALKYNKPLYFHIRLAHDDFISLLLKYGFSPESPPPVPCVVHCFTGSRDELQQYLSFGFYIGLTGYIFNSLSREDLADYLQLITLDRLVVETDAPYMGFKGCRKHEEKKKGQKYPNVPSSLVQIAEYIAEVGGWTVSEVAERTTDNALRFFGVDRNYRGKSSE